MHHLQPVIQRILQKLQQLLKAQEQLQKENARLKATLQQKEDEINAFSEKIILLEQQNSIMKSSGGQMTESEKKAFEKKINQYIRDIDKAIAQLSS